MEKETQCVGMKQTTVYAVKNGVKLQGRDACWAYDDYQLDWAGDNPRLETVDTLHLSFGQVLHCPNPQFTLSLSSLLGRIEIASDGAPDPTLQQNQVDPFCWGLSDVFGLSGRYRAPILCLGSHVYAPLADENYSDIM